MRSNMSTNFFENVEIESESNDVSLATKYPPLTINEIPWPQEHRERLERLLTKPNHILFGGATGVGKTTVARLLIQLLDYEEYWIDGTKTGRIEDIKDAYVASRSGSLFGKKKIIVIDEADS